VKISLQIVTIYVSWWVQIVGSKHCGQSFFTGGNRSGSVAVTDTGELVNRTGKIGYRPVTPVNSVGPVAVKKTLIVACGLLQSDVKRCLLVSTCDCKPQA
jgi:hypothetical protein